MAKKRAKSARPRPSRSNPTKRGAKRRATKRSGGVSKVSGALSDFCRALPGTTEDIKWGDNLIFSVGGRMYAGFEVDDEDEFAFKCDEVDFDRLTTEHGEAIIPAPYAAKSGWVKVMKKGALKDAEARAFLRKAHSLIAACLSKKKRVVLGLE